VELSTILKRFSEGLSFVDANTGHVSANRRTGEVYLPGVKTLSEPKFVEELLNWWRQFHSLDFKPENASDREVPYPNVPRAKCDLILSTDGSPLESPEWSIEVKHIALVGNNGNNNDYGVAKLLSPYLKDRALIHDLHRLKDHGIGKRKAVVGYCFEYDFESCRDALIQHPNQSEYIANIRKVCRKNDPSNGRYTVMDMIDFANEIFLNRGLVKPVQVENFQNAWRHPCGGKGNIFGWELLN